MNLELLNRIKEAYRSGEIIPISIRRKTDEVLLKDIHDLYLRGYLHLPKYCQVFGYLKYASLIKLFRTRGYPTLNPKQVREIYRDDILEKTKKTNIEKFGCETFLGSPEVREVIKKTNLERYGCENPFANADIKSKISKTLETKYGVNHPMRSEEIKNKAKSTNLERYGCENPVQSPTVREKMKQTNLERYGHENPFGNKDIQDKIKKTNLERYGHENPFGSHEIQEKIKIINLDRYGFEYATQSPEIQGKTKQTNLERYGHENPFQNPTVREKVRKTNLERYGFEHALQSPEIMERVKQTNIERFGFEYALQSPEIIEKLKSTRKSNDRRYAKLGELVDNEPNKVHEFVHQNYSYCYQSTVLKRYGLYQENLSTIEIAIREILEKHNIEYLFRHRPKFMNRKELDFFIPNKSLAIEVNGLYWHSTKFRDKFYHQDKHLRCRSEGIQLLSFTEDQILEKSEIIESMILHKLGLTPYRVYAKNCTIRELRSQEAKDFLEKNHLHGFSNASVYLGLEYQGKLVHVMSFGNNRFKRSNHPELIRSASLRFHSVAGGFQRLLKYYKRTYKVDLVESYVDFNISNGNSYELASRDLGDLGVGPERETERETPRDNLTEPDLWFVFRGKRYRRQMFMKHNLHKIFEDFPKRGDQGYENITCGEFLRDRGVLEYYGAGNLKYLI